MAEKTFQLSVITPDRSVVEVEATFCAIPAHDGEIGVHAHRAPMLVKLGTGWLRAQTTDGDTRLLVDGGFAQMVGNQLSVLTEFAQKSEEIDASTAQADLAAAVALPAKSDSEFATRQRAIARARAALKAG